MTQLRLFVLVFFLVSRLSAQSNNPELTYRVTLDLQNVTPDKDRVKVSILTPAIHNTTINYILPAYIPGVPGKVDAGRFIHQFYALDDKGYPLKVSKKGNNIIVMKMRKGSTLRKIEYWVDDTWDDEKARPKDSDEKFNYVPQFAGSNIDAGNNYVLNHAFFFGYIDGFSDLAYSVTVLRPSDLRASSVLKVNSESATKDNYQASSYQQLIDNPVMYCKPDTCGFLAGNIYVNISCYSENGRVTARLIRRLIATSVISSGNFVPEIGSNTYKMIFYFTTPFKTVLNKYGGYGGLAHKQCGFYFLPELADEDALANELNRETAGDILHVLSPLDYQSVCGTANFLKPQMCSSWWFSEGVNMYFAWLSGIRDSTINEDEFMGNVGSKIRLAQLAPNKPITDMKVVMNWMKSPLNKEAMRSRAMLIAFMLDIKMTELSGGKCGLREAVLQLDQKGRMYSDSLETWLLKISGNQLQQFFADYVNGAKPLPLINSFDKIGWAYAPSAIDSVLTFGQFGLLYNDNLDAFFVYNADTTNLFGLRNGDRIVSVDGIIVGSSTFDEALHSVYSPKKNDEIELRFIRNEQNFTAHAIPVVKAVLVEYLIRKDPAAGSAALQLHQQIFAPPTTW